MTWLESNWKGGRGFCNLSPDLSHSKQNTSCTSPTHPNCQCLSCDCDLAGCSDNSFLALKACCLTFLFSMDILPRIRSKGGMVPTVAWGPYTHLPYKTMLKLPWKGQRALPACSSPPLSIRMCRVRKTMASSWSLMTSFPEEVGMEWGWRTQVLVMRF